MKPLKLKGLGQEGRNGKKALRVWVEKTLADLKNPEDINFLTKEATKVIEWGGFRGNISDIWRSHGWNTEQIPGMYN